jgi:putative component of toxin-antitoxin plasmid stabilization module
MVVTGDIHRIYHQKMAMFEVWVICCVVRKDQQKVID